MTLTELLTALAVFAIGLSLAASSAGGLIDAMRGGEAVAGDVSAEITLEAVLDRFATVAGEGDIEIDSETNTVRAGEAAEISIDRVLPDGVSIRVTDASGPFSVEISRIDAQGEPLRWSFDETARVLALIEGEDGQGRILASARLHVNAPLNCRYDLIGHVCRRPEG